MVVLSWHIRCKSVLNGEQCQVAAAPLTKLTNTVCESYCRLLSASPTMAVFLMHRDYMLVSFR